MAFSGKSCLCHQLTEKLNFLQNRGLNIESTNDTVTIKKNTLCGEHETEKLPKKILAHWLNFSNPSGMK